MSKNWYALRVKPHKEKSVFQRLEEEGIEGYLPTVEVQPVNPRSAKIKPYFPGYLFIFTDLEDIGANKFRWLHGAIGLVEFGNIPAVVPSNLISDLQQLMGRIKKEGGLAKFEFKHGDSVRIVEGPFEGYEAMFDLHLPGSDRAQVLLAFLSQAPQPIQLDTAAIKKIKK
jgi:transcription antitermination factor NusG